MSVEESNPIGIYKVFKPGTKVYVRQTVSPAVVSQAEITYITISMDGDIVYVIRGFMTRFGEDRVFLNPTDAFAATYE